MNKILSDMLKVKVDGKYVKSAQEVAEHHGVHKNAVYQSRKNKKNPDRLDKLMLFDEAVQFLDCEEGKGLRVVYRLQVDKMEWVDSERK